MGCNPPWIEIWLPAPAQLVGVDFVNAKGDQVVDVALDFLGAIVLFHTGFGRHWPDASTYFGTAEKGVDAVAKLHFPGLYPDAARWLASERRIKAVGIDTASIDYGQSTLFQAHWILFEKDIPALTPGSPWNVAPDSAVSACQSSHPLPSREGV